VQHTVIFIGLYFARSAKWAPRAGTAGFRSPEVLFRYENQTTAVDCWAAGIILLSLLSGRYPFFKSTDDSMAIMQLISVFGSDKIRKTAMKYGETIVCDVEKETADLKNICKSLRKTPLDFPDCAYDLLKGLLELDFEKRLSAQDALKHSFFTVS
jgi:cell division control protein 7